MPEGFPPSQPLSEINVTPLVDVMLVLLVIFMVTAPMFSQGVPVELPGANAPELVREKPLVVSISRERLVYLGERQVDLASLKETLIREVQGQPDPEVLLQADREVPYGLVVRVMGLLREAGVQKLGIVTAPPAAEVKS